MAHIISIMDGRGQTVLCAPAKGGKVMLYELFIS